jgi:transposase-like protein
MSKQAIRYSEAFKMQVVSDVEKGRFGSIYEASEAYGICGKTTVRRWVNQYGRNHLLKRVVRVEKPGEPGELKRMKDRIRKLEAALADAHMDSALDKAFFELLCEQEKVDPEAFKKKADGLRSTRRAK